MRFIVNGATIGVVLIIVCSCATSRNIHDAPLKSKVTTLNEAIFMQNISKKIEQQVPEMKTLMVTAGRLPSSSVWWHGEEYTNFGFFLPKKLKSAPQASKFSPQVPGPIPDVNVIICRYTSAGEALHDIEKSLAERPAMSPPTETYKGAVLYRYSSGSGVAICQSDHYVIEINPLNDDGSPFVMKMLDVVLAELDSSSSKSKR